MDNLSENNNLSEKTELISSTRHLNQVSDDKRLNLIELVSDLGKSIKDSAEFMKINYSTARTIISDFNNTGKIKKSKKGGRLPIISTPVINTHIEEIYSENPRITLTEIKHKLEHEQGRGFTISVSTIDRILKKLLITVKKSNRDLDRVNGPIQINLRKVYSLWFKNQFSNDFTKLVFVGESSFNLHLQRSQNRSRIGTGPNLTRPTISGRSVSLITSMSINGIVYSKTTSKSTVNANFFSEFLSDLCSYSKNILHLENMYIILDNARIHEEDEIRRISASFEYYYKFLSPYSYMLNPIENVFSKIKEGVRSRLRMGEGGNLSDMVLSECDNIAQLDCKEYFRCMSININNCAAEIPYVPR